MLINGVPATQIEAIDRGLQYGDGLFETITCRDGRARWLPLHWARLRVGCERLGIDFVQFDELQQEVAQLAAETDACVIKVIVTRGAATRRGYAPTGDEHSTRIVARYPWPLPNPTSTRGFRVACAHVTLGINPLLAGLKHLNRLEQVLAQRECQRRGLDEVLMLTGEHEVIGGSMSNVFVGHDDALVTPNLERCGVAGVMRARVLSAAAHAGIAVAERAVAASELAAATEIFVTNVRWELQSVDEIEGRRLGTDRIAGRLREVLDAS